MDKRTPGRVEKCEHTAAQLPIVMESDSTILIKVLIRDMRHYDKFLLRRLTTLDGVSGVHSCFILHHPVNKTEQPI